MIKKAILKGIIFFIIIVLVIYAIDPIFINKVGGHRSKLTQGLYMSEDNSYDVVLIGSSHMNGAINPSTLWDKYGITSFNYATGGEPFDVSYYLIKEVLKSQNKSIVAVDVYYLGLTEPYGSEGYIRSVLDNMKFSINKIDAVIHCTPRKDWLYYIFPFFKYHGRWKELRENDYNYNYNAESYLKGFSAGCNKYGKDSSSDISSKETTELPAKSEKYLNKMIELSKQMGFKLIFINAPHDYTSTAGFKNWVKEPAKMYNKIAEIANNNNIPFINYNNMFDQIGFDFKSDMNNEGHVNIWGADKITIQFGEYLKSNYDVVSHKDDAKFANWNTDLKIYNRRTAADKLIGEHNINKYIKMLKDENYVVALSSNNNSNISTDLKYALKQIGLRLDNAKNNKNYIAVIDNNKKPIEKWDNSNLSAQIAIQDNKTIKIISSDENSNAAILIDETDYAYKGNGLNIVVYDKIFCKVVDSIFIDSSNKILRKE